MIRKLSQKEKEDLIEKIKGQYGSGLSIEGTLLEKEEKRESKKIFLYTGDRIPDVPAEWIGLHFCTLKDDIIIPSIEGAQAIGRTASKTIEMSNKEAEAIMSGRDVYLGEEKEGGYYIIKRGEDVLGIGFVENGKIMNLTPKSRRTGKQYETL